MAGKEEKAKVESKVEMIEPDTELQIIGLDIGRGYVKGSTEFRKEKKECLFKSVIGDGRELEFQDYEDPIYINFNDRNYFVGLLAEEESKSPVRNSDDSKVSLTVRVLVAAALSKLASTENISLMLGVPNRAFNKRTLKQVTEEYKGKTFKIKDKITSAIKEVTIREVNICKEGDAALIYTLDGTPNTNPVAIAVVGYRTTELSYFNPKLKAVDKLSETYEFGNQNVLSIIKSELESQGIIKETFEIDSSDFYDEMKKKEYEEASERLSQYLSEIWKNTGEMTTYIGGGTALHMTFPSNFKIIEDTQMATARGLRMIAAAKA